MLSFALLWAASGQGVTCEGCGLSTDYDPNQKCCVDQNGFPSLDADSTSGAISLAIYTKGIYKDVFGTEHPATAGGADALEDDTDKNSRYVLDCPQVAGLKTIKMTIFRPKVLTAFGAEWVKLFEKDSWKNETNEYEPFTFNEYGAKIPIADDRQPANGLESDAPPSDYLTVFMEVSAKGDFEIMYGNPGLTYGAYWVPVRFESTLLRVGNPWAKCDGVVLEAPEYSVGSIMPILFGGPNTASIAIKKDADKKDVDENYLTVISELSNAPVPVIVVLEIFGRKGEASAFADTSVYTDSEGETKSCYKAGNACPEKHSVCDPSYCEIDVWKALIKGFQDTSPDTKVYGSVDSAATLTLYEAQSLGLNGYFFTMDCAEDSPSSCSVPTSYTETTSVLALGKPLFDENLVSKAGVYVTLADSELGFWNPYSWYSTTLPSKWAALVTGASSDTASTKYFGKTIDTLVDRGYGWIYATDQTGDDAFGTKNGLDMTALLAAIEKPTTKRRLADRRLTASAPYWGCDDTLFMCKPICLRQTGVVTTKVADTLCTSAPMDQCACKCYHEAQWACDGDAVVCKAKEGAGDLKTVGDKVCETRGAPKPASTAELRIASTCEPVTEMRGDAPTSKCLAQWATTPAPKEETSTAAPDTATATATPAETNKVSVPVIQESFAATLAVAALALYA